MSSMVLSAYWLTIGLWAQQLQLSELLYWRSINSIWYQIQLTGSFLPSNHILFRLKYIMHSTYHFWKSLHFCILFTLKLCNHKLTHPQDVIQPLSSHHIWATKKCNFSQSISTQTLGQIGHWEPLLPVAKKPGDSPRLLWAERVHTFVGYRAYRLCQHITMEDAPGPDFASNQNNHQSTQPECKSGLLRAINILRSLEHSLPFDAKDPSS